MNQTAEFGERIKKFYAGHSIYIDMAGKFILALVSFLWIYNQLDFNAFLSNFFVILVMAILSTVLPVIAIPVFDAILIVGQAFGAGIDAGAVAIALYLVLLIMFLRFVPDEAWETAAMPVLMAIRLPLFLPLVCGLKRRVSSAFAVGSGIVIYHFVRALSSGAGSLAKLEVSDYAERLDIIVGGTFNNSFIIHLIGCAAALIVVYAVRNLSVNYAFMLSVFLGTGVYIVLGLIGNAVLGRSGSAADIIGALISMALALVFLAADTPLDYGKCENLRFEDDDYYYYVKAVPKISSASYDDENKGTKDKGDEDAVSPNIENVDFEQKLEDSLKNL